MTFVLGLGHENFMPHINDVITKTEILQVFRECPDVETACVSNSHMFLVLQNTYIEKMSLSLNSIFSTLGDWVVICTMYESNNLCNPIHRVPHHNGEGLHRGHQRTFQETARLNVSGD